jgi:ribulose 1,5-bisphosphate carboxylase large subunit-like protein
LTGECLATIAHPAIDDAIVATCFLAFRTLRLNQSGEEIAYHATRGVRRLPAGSLLEECTAKAVGVDAFDSSGRVGLVHMAFPLKMLLQPDGHFVSCDLLHIRRIRGQDVQLIDLQIPGAVLRSFSGPAPGPHGIRQITRFPPDAVALGTILKPTAATTPDVVEALVAEAARCERLIFTKEDEDLYPNLAYSPVRVRTHRTMAAIEGAHEKRGGRGLIFAPHITGAPHELRETVDAVRLVREATKHLEVPPVIYGRNGGIGV